MSSHYLDYQFGFPEIIPSSNRHKQSFHAFNGLISKAINSGLPDVDLFPTTNPVLIIILQFFKFQTEYDRRDVDNMSKTMLDTLKGKLFNDDVQVKTLIVSKHVERRIPENFIFVGIKITTTDQDTGMIQANKAEAIALYKQSKPTEA